MGKICRPSLAFSSSLRRNDYFLSQIPVSSIFSFIFSFRARSVTTGIPGKRLSHWQRLFAWQSSGDGHPTLPLVYNHFKSSSTVQFYGLPVEVESALAGGGRWHAAVGTVGGNCFPGICQPRVTLAICSPPNALHLLSGIFTLAICWSCNALQLLSDSLVTLYTFYLLVLQRFTLDSGDYLLVVVLTIC